MKPSDAKQQDWQLYYHQTWMMHSTHGPVLVYVDGNSLVGFKPGENFDKDKRMTFRASCLTPWWPRGGAFNTAHSAVYITRRAQRNMRKSAVGGGHYICTYGSLSGRNVMEVIAEPRPYYSVEEARELIFNPKTKRKRAAVTQDIILTQQVGVGDTLGVYFRGMYAGTLKDNWFEPIATGHPMGKRAAIKMAKEGIL